MKTKMLSFFLGIFTVCNLHAQVVYVDAANTSGVEDGTQIHPYNTPEEGMVAALAGQTLSIRNGTYVPSGGILYLKPGVVIVGESREKTLISGEVFRVSSASATLKNNTITGEGGVSGITINSGPPTNITGNKITLNNGIPVKDTYGISTSSGFGVVTGVESLGTGGMTLFQNYPNPFSGETTFVYSISRPGNVRIIVYDSSGRELKILVNEQKSAGIYQVIWSNPGTKEGFFFGRIETGGLYKTIKLVSLK
jgi:hypothetical protein